jgi:predicted TIM-barrel fold metal-dependent hydrolase
VATTQKIWANSGDSHILEPKDIWSANMPAALAERMPRTEHQPDGTEIIYVDGYEFTRPRSIVMKEGEFKGLKFSEIELRPPGTYDPVLRLKDLDDEGIWGEVIYPSVAMWSGFIQDPALFREGVRVMNDWLQDKIMRISPRFVPTALVSIRSVEDAVAEMQRTRGLGFQAIQLPTWVEDQPNWNADYWEPLWAACAEAGTVLAFHIGSDVRTGKQHSNKTYRGPGGAVLNYVETSYTGQRVATMLVASGVLDRHPNLRVLISEGGATWVPFIADRMDEAYRQHGFMARPKLSRLPGEIIMSQIYTSFQHDPSAVGASRFLGYRNVMWGSDYPHVEGTFGHTQKTLHELFDDTPSDIVDRITQGAFLELFPSVGAPPAEAVVA